jgi:tetratricopeptide (TPR) repeat protein
MSENQESEHSHVVVNENSPVNLGSSIEVVNDLSKSTNSPNNLQYGDKSPFRQAHEANQSTIPVGSSHLDSLSTDNLEEEKTSVSPPSQASNVHHQEQEEDLSTRISKSISIKNSAKSLVNQAKYDEAIRIYESAYYALRPTGKDRIHPDFKKCLLLQAELFNNLSYCYGSLERFQESVEYAKRVLLVDGENTKALYRSAVGHKNMGQFMTAYDEIKKAKQIYKRQHPDQPLDAKIHELYASLQQICKPDLEKRKNKEKEIYSKMLGTSPVSKNSSPQKETEPSRSALSYKVVRYGLCLGPIVMLTVIGWRVVKERTVRAIKRQIPAIITAIGALLVLRYIKNNVRGSIWGTGLAVAAAIMIQRTSKDGVFYKK